MEEAVPDKNVLVAFDLDDTLYKEADYLKNGLDISLDRFTLKTLQSLKEQGYRMAIITDGLSKVQRAKIKALGLDEFIDTLDIIISEEMGTEKTCRANFEYFTQKYPECKKFYYIGDNTAKDFFHPNAMGWTTICLADNGCNKHPQNFEGDVAYMPDFIIEDFYEILEFIEE